MILLTSTFEDRLKLTQQVHSLSGFPTRFHVYTFSRKSFLGSLVRDVVSTLHPSTLSQNIYFPFILFIFLEIYYQLIIQRRLMCVNDELSFTNDKQGLDYRYPDTGFASLTNLCNCSVIKVVVLISEERDRCIRISYLTRVYSL